MNRTYETMSKKELVTLVKRLTKQHDEWSDEAKRLREDIVSILGAIDLPDYDEFPLTHKELRNMMVKYGQEHLIHEVIE